MQRYAVFPNFDKKIDFCLYWKSISYGRKNERNLLIACFIAEKSSCKTLIHNTISYSSLTQVLLFSY